MTANTILIEKNKHFTGHAAAVFTVAQGLHKNSVISGAGDGLVAEWFLDSDAPATGIAQIPANIFSICLIEKHNLLIIGQMRGGIHVIDLLTKKEITNLGRNTASVFDMYFDTVTDILWIACGDGNLIRWKIPSFELLHTDEISYQSIRSIAFNHTQHEVSFGCSDNKIHVYDTDTFRVKHILTGHTNSVFSVCYAPDNTYMLSGSRDAQLIVWEAENNYERQQIIPAHLYTINDIKFSPDGKLVATAGRDKHIKIWNSDTFQLLKVLDYDKYRGHKNSVNKLFWSTWNNTLISCGDDKTIITWDVKISD
ncbi:MAG: WD40 repeat domain-containing protein [Chitinophagales bacterium]|nr:WD40 repeat domain-containing protein [Chitinophagales bacterium]